MRIGFIVGPVRRKRVFLVVWPGPVRPRRHHPRPGKHRGRRLTPNRRTLIVSFKLQDNQEVDLSVTGEDEAGNPVDISGTLTWASSDTSVLIVTETPSGATAAATGKLGSAQIQVTDAETNGGQVAGTLDVDVTAGPAVSISIVPGEPRDA